MPHTYTSLLVHAVFATAERRPLLKAGPRERIHAYLGGILRDLKAHPIQIGGVADHVHILIDMPPTLSVAEVIGLAKGNCSRWINETFKTRFAWQRGYGAFAVSESNRDAVARYICDQERHHREQTFEDEYRELLKAHNIRFDERFLWT
jgi:putative transposase